MTTGIRVACQRCGAEVDSSQRDHAGICAICILRDLVQPLQAEYGRLWLKYQRYQRADSPRSALQRIEQQMYRVAMRIDRRVSDRIANPKAAVETHNGFLAEARAQAEGRHSQRLLVPA